MTGRSRIPTPEIITRPTTDPGDWALRFELVDNHANLPSTTDPSELPFQRLSYSVCPPIGAVVAFDDAERYVLQAAMDGVSKEEMAAQCSEIKKTTIQPKSLGNISRSAVYTSKSQTLAEATCKAIVLQEVAVHVTVPKIKPVDAPKLVILASRGVGYEFEEMDLSVGIDAISTHSGDTRAILGAPNRAPHPNLMARAFAAGALVIGKPYKSPPSLPILR